MESIVIGGVRVTAPRGTMTLSRVHTKQSKLEDIIKNIGLDNDTIFKTGDILPTGDFLIPPGDHSILLSIDCDVPLIASTFVSLDVSFVSGSNVIHTFNVTRSVVRVGSLTIISEERFSTTVPTLMRIKLTQDSDDIRIRSGSKFNYRPINIKIKSTIEKND